MEDKSSIRRSLCMCALLLLSSLLVCASMGSVQVLEGAIRPWELNALRFFVQIVVALPLALYHGHRVRLPEYKDLTPSLLLSLSLYFVSITLFNVAYFTASTYVPVENAWSFRLCNLHSLHCCYVHMHQTGPQFVSIHWCIFIMYWNHSNGAT